jgi:protease II
MAKTKKNLKFKKNKKNKKINKSKKNKILNYTNSGFSEFIYKDGNKTPRKTSIKWNDDGNNTKIHMNTNIDGKEKKTTLNLSDDKIRMLLGSMTAVDKSIDQRLINDFSLVLPRQQIISPFNKQMLFMRDIDVIPMSSIKGKK